MDLTVLFQENRINISDRSLLQFYSADYINFTKKLVPPFVELMYYI